MLQISPAVNNQVSRLSKWVTNKTIGPKLCSISQNSLMAGFSNVLIEKAARKAEPSVHRQLLTFLFANNIEVADLLRCVPIIFGDDSSHLEGSHGCKYNHSPFATTTDSCYMGSHNAPRATRACRSLSNAPLALDTICETIDACSACMISPLCIFDDFQSAACGIVSASAPLLACLPAWPCLLEDLRDTPECSPSQKAQRGDPNDLASNIAYSFTNQLVEYHYNLSCANTNAGTKRTEGQQPTAIPGGCVASTDSNPAADRSGFTKNPKFKAVTYNGNCWSTLKNSSLVRKQTWSVHRSTNCLAQP